MSKKKSELIRSKVFYFGTSIGDSFWRRYKVEEWLERGFGELWLTNKELNFRRYLTLEPVTFKIPTKAIKNIGTGHAIAGKISLPPVMKIKWIRDEETLVSGFSIPKKVDELRQWQLKLQKMMKAKLK